MSLWRSPVISFHGTSGWDRESPGETRPAGLPYDLELADQRVLHYPIPIELRPVCSLKQFFDSVERLEHVLKEEMVRLRHRRLWKRMPGPNPG